MPEEMKKMVCHHLSINSNFDNMDEKMTTYIDEQFVTVYKQWKSDLHKFFEL
ncbi:hypothetical protein C1H46_012251 [Malus baccata]|uniref:Uncharacterized protein n=1 Tax=Malus baccata TaxID=106549 RepID=A0A540MV59_MALBA|nr:hypothetical protein C1H46_012251 [Malus baccata]